MNSTEEDIEVRLKGSPICAGIAIGRPFFFIYSDESVPEFSIENSEVPEEIARYRRALSHSEQEIRRLQKQLEIDGALEGVNILDTHLQIMRDPIVTSNIEKQIEVTRKNAEYIFQTIIKSYEKKFNNLKDKFFRERFKDVRDISRRIMKNLRKSASISLADIPSNSIVFAHDLVASETAETKKSQVGAFVTETGGETSHAAIIARARGIPFVSSVDFQDVQVGKNTYVIVDGRTGEVIINPRESTLNYYQTLQYQLDNQIQSLQKIGGLLPETIDGYKVKLSANVEMENELELLHQYGGEGVGLFRSEYICLSHESFPSEEEQFRIYKNIISAMKGLPIVIRTFDVGGDKFREFLNMRNESNPFLGCRAIRFMLREREAFKMQLRAILRASSYGNVSIMFPMVSGSFELLEAKDILKEAMNELDKENFAYKSNIKIGCMIEVPSAAITCDVLAKECDFLSIGTNDLVQYSLAVDRGNQSMSYLYNPTHPSVIRLIKMIVTEGHSNGIPVSICGEIAADPRFTALLLGLGVHELSCSARYLPIVKNAIRNTSIVSANKLAERILVMSDAQEIQDAIHEEYQKTVPCDLLHNHA